MWIWYVTNARHGKVAAIVAMAHRYRIGTLIIKSGDGTGYWSQFNSSLVGSLHAAGLKVCAWQFVYGAHPHAEARVGAGAVKAGADCLLIDAESSYEGRYVQAQAYMQKLRTLVGNSFPLGLASFPYVDFHPAFPYSVFLAPGGAQFNVPQMYWQDIGDTVNTVYAHTYTTNTPYRRTIVPLGQLYNNPPSGKIKHFRQLDHVYGAPGVSWWDWDSATTPQWKAVSAAIKKLDATPHTVMPTLSSTGGGGLASGDLVVWAQEHLVSAGYRVQIDGTYGSKTQRAVKQFQAAHQLRITGQVDVPTWTALLHYRPATVTWTKSGAHATGASARHLTLAPPSSARLPAVGYEIPPNLGAGSPGRSRSAG